MNTKKLFIYGMLLLASFLLVVSTSCKKEDDDPTPPVENGDNGDNGDSNDFSGTSGTFIDTRDETEYKWVRIGGEEEKSGYEAIWMAENLAYAPTNGNYWAYDNDDANVEVYGYLYDWETALNVCPNGWHLPSDAEWTELTDYLGDNPGGKLKATGTIAAETGLWNEPNNGATNETGFTALPGGERRPSGGTFHRLGEFGRWWSASESSSSHARHRDLQNNLESIVRLNNDKGHGFSVRCVKD